jgi:geranylgeranyl diphosphate synthase type I
MFKDKNVTHSELDAVLKKRGQKILNRLEQVVVSGVNNSELRSILLELTNCWGDMFRPTLTSLSCEAVGGQPEIAEDAGLMFTILAAGIGIHDDIIDQSSVNHFRKTILGRYGLEKALLVGDLLIVKAWTMINEMIMKTRQPTKIANIVKIYGNLCVEICEAELMETSCKQKLCNELEYHKEILWKAMAEIEACTRIGAILGEGTANEVQALAEFGRRLGFISRLTDDVKDSFNLEGNLPHRIQYESIPLPIIFASGSSKEKFQKIKSIIEKLPISPSDSKELLQICFESGAFAYVLDIAKKNKREANRNLRLLKPSNARNMLSLMVKRSYVDLSNWCL